MKVNEIMRKTRIEQGLTQRLIANRTNTTVPYVCIVELGRSQPSPGFLREFCSLTGLNMVDMVYKIIEERAESLRRNLYKRYMEE